MNLTPCFGRRKGYETRKIPHRSDRCPVEAGPAPDSQAQTRRTAAVRRTGAKSSTPSSISSAAASSGECFPTTFRHGERSITTIGNGVAMACGRRSRTPCGPRSGTRPAGTKALSAAIIDSQTVKTTEMGGPRGYDAGKRVKGRKRHILVDTWVCCWHRGPLRGHSGLPARSSCWPRSWAGSRGCG